MDWNLAIEKNKTALAQMIAGLFVLVNWRKGGKPPEVLGPMTFRRLRAALRALEAATRRLIVLYVKVRGVEPDADTTSQDLRPGFSPCNNEESDRLPSFNLIDPRKPLVYITDDEEMTDTTVRQSGEKEDTDLMPSPERSARLLKRLLAVDHAIRNLSQQAKRLVRLMEKRKKAPPGVGRIGPIRPGFPPGFRANGKDEVDHVLRECHSLVRDLEMCPP